MNAGTGDPIIDGAQLLARGEVAAAENLAAGILARQPEHPDALHLLGLVRIRQKRPDEAVTLLQHAVQARPDQPQLLMELGELYLRMGLTAEAETVLAKGLAQLGEPQLRSAFAYKLGLAQYDQGKRQAALDSFSLVAALEPDQAMVAITRADLLQELTRHGEAEKILKELVARDPANAQAHVALNELLFRLGREEEFLASFGRVPATTNLTLSKANLLFKTGRPEGAAALFAEILSREPQNRDAALGASFALNKLGRHGEAMALLEGALARQPRDVALHNNLAATALQARDPQKAVFHSEKSLLLMPVNALGLATLGSAWRMMGDARDEMLNGYDELVQIFDLEAPAGFSGMAAFNAELKDWLAKRHDTIREPIEQSLRGGSQTSGHIFNEGHGLIESLKSRITEAVAAYIAGIRPEARHPFRGRKSAGFRYSGSWSSRLRDCGYHVNHIHPAGWISSCYYVGVPAAVEDDAVKQGWIKFGEPAFDTGLGFRRAIRPVPGRLVLFPSYMWHGTIPFHDACPRTTIAFDVVPR